MSTYDAWLAACSIDPSVGALRPDYHAVLMVAEGLSGGASNERSEAMLAAAEQQAVAALGEGRAEDLPHVAAWREAFRAFGAKPQRTRNSAEALIRRAPEGLPRINSPRRRLQRRLGEPPGATGRRGPVRLPRSAPAHRATGDEPFDTLASGAEVIENPEPGEVVWRDDEGITCRRWNWRQCQRTRVTETTRDAIFVADVLDVEPGDAAARSGAVLEALTEALETVSPGVQVTSRIIPAS